MKINFLIIIITNISQQYPIDITIQTFTNYQVYKYRKSGKEKFRFFTNAGWTSQKVDPRNIEKLSHA